MSTPPHQKSRPLGLKDVTIGDRFWGPRLKTLRARTLGSQLEQFRKTGHLEALKLNGEGGGKGVPRAYWDSEVAKWIEAASDCLAAGPDQELEAQLEDVAALVCGAQQADGYLNTYITRVKPEKRWGNLRDEHELYCAGHLIEAAVAHFEGTGKRTLLESARRYADLIEKTFGAEEGKKRGYCGHAEIELALVRLYRATGEKKYLKLSQFFIDERGRQPHYFDGEARARGEDSAAYWAKSYEYNQSHVPVREQSEVAGHAVRAMYLYAAMADVAGESGDASLRAASERIFKHLCEKNLYVTGGLGTSRRNEGFTAGYDLPNETAYAETCAAIGLVFWSHRLLQLDCDGRYADILERALYNGALSGISLDGTKYFYENPLASTGRHQRQAWFECACCPPNIARLLASLGRYVYSQNENEAIIHLYVQGSGTFNLGGRKVVVSQQSDYPWDGKVTIKVEPEKKTKFRLKFRVPEWCRDAKVFFEGAVSIVTQKGYMQIEREWSPGEQFEVHLGMPVERIHAHPKVRQNCGRVALQRGPLVYCLEELDNGGDLGALALHPAVKLEPKFEADLLGGAVSLNGEAMRSLDAGWEGILYRPVRATLRPAAIKAVPYCLWGNRVAGEMGVWVRQT